jgi:hypothetical protein
MMIAGMIGAMLLSLQPAPVQATTPPASVPAQEQAPATPPAEPIVWRSGPHWRASFLRSSTLEYYCPGHNIEIRLRNLVRNTEGGHGIQVEALRVDGRPVAAARVTELNAKLVGFASPPAIYPLCTQERVALELLSTERSITQSERFYLD